MKIHASARRASADCRVSGELLMETLKSSLAVVLCVTLGGLPMPAQSPRGAASGDDNPSRPKVRAEYRSGEMQGDQRILHALNRFTFGVRPGDLDSVKREGLEDWFERQLHPASLDNAELKARLAAFPAMQWGTADLLYRLPSDGMIRQAADGRIPYPQSGALHAVYMNQMDRYAIRKQAKEEKKQQAATTAGGPQMTAGRASGQAVTESQSGDATMTSADARPERQFDEGEMNAIVNLAPQQRLARLVSMNEHDFDGFRKSLRGPQRDALIAGMDASEKEVVGALENPKKLVNDELCEQRLTRDIYSNAQLQEVMTDFWLNHFNVFLHKNDETPYYLVSYERDVIRPRALGRFEDLLEATAHSPAMMLYLDNASSIGPDSIAAERAGRNGKDKAKEGLNENYARELMELHTVGVNGGYTQKDVTQVARVFTGWGVDRPQRGGGFEFNPNRHEPGTKTVLGKKIKEQGEREGEEVLHMLATRPQTAEFISRKLAIRFVSDDPPRSLVDRMAKTYMSSGGDISAMLLTLFHAPEFWSADDYRAKVKTPIEYVVSAVRASNAQVEDLNPIVNALHGMGMPLYGAVPPTGYNWEASTWVSAGALVNRMNFALALASNRFGGLPTWSGEPGATVAAPSARSAVRSIDLPEPGAEEQRLEWMLVGGGVSDSTRAAILQQLEAQTGTTNDVARDASAPIARPVIPAQAARGRERQDQVLAGLLLGSPEFQRR